MMIESIETDRSTEKDEIIEDTKGELESLSSDVLGLNVKKESFKARQELKDRIKALGFYNGNESGEDIKFNIANVKKYLESIKNKTWADLDVKASQLEKGVWTIAIQIAINYINMKNGNSTNKIELIDGIRGDQTWKGVKEFQTTYKLKNIDGLPGRETISKILELLGNDVSDDDTSLYTEEIPIGNNNQGNNSDYNIEDNIGEGNDIGEEPSYLGLNHNDIDDSKCLSLFGKLNIVNTNNLQNPNRKDFEEKLRTRFADKSGLESIVFQNPEIQIALNIIISHQLEDIEIMKDRYKQKMISEDENLTEKTDDQIEKNIEEVSQGWEEYRYENYTINNYEEFILSDEGIAIIIDEIKSHVDTRYQNNNGEYDKFCEKYPFSVENLEIRLKNARESRMKSDFNNENYDEEMEKQDTISNQITWNIEQIVGDYLKSDKEDFNNEIILSLKGLLSKGFDDGVPYDKLYADKEQKNAKNAFKGVLSGKIKSYERFVRKGDVINLNTGNKQIDLQLKSYLYFYGSIFYPDIFNSNGDAKYYEGILPEVMKTILSNDDTSLTNKIVHKEFLVAEKKLEKERRERDLQRRKEIARRIRERNNHIGTAPKMDKLINTGELQGKYVDPNNATGTEIAAEADLGRALDDYNLNIEESEEKTLWMKESAFREAWKKFIESHDNIKTLITQEQMRRLFNIDSNSFNTIEWERFKNFNPLFKGMSSNEIEEIRIILSGFSSYFTETEKNLSNNSSEGKVKINETVKTYAIGAVIDNVRDTFETITEGQNGDSEGFQLSKENPVKKEGDNIIISGSFNGSDIKVRYDLKTGELFMNTFLHRLSPSKIRIGEDSSIDYKIGAIQPFNDVLNDYYKFPSRPSNSDERHNGPQSGKDIGKDPNNHQRPTHEWMKSEYGLPLGRTPRQIPPSGGNMGPEMPRLDESNINFRRQEAANILNSQITLIGRAIKDNTESQTQKNSAINKFMKTFNIMGNVGEFSSLDFNKGSNLFDVIEIIENTGDIKNGDIQALEYFNNTFMPKIMEYSGLNWGERNEYQDKENEKAKRIFNYNGDNESINYLKNKVKNFDPEQFSGIADFNTSHQLGLADLIKEKLVTGSELYLKLDVLKMENFIKDLEIEEKDIDKDLDRQLTSI